MNSCLHSCPACARHIRASETGCPFCGARLPEGFGVCAKSKSAAGPALSRAAVLFVGATAAASCGGTADATGTSDAAADTTTDAANDAAVDAGDGGDGGGPVALYGPAPIDVGHDAAEDSGLAPMYGPATVDAGNG
jgi:hypothetical protein